MDATATDLHYLELTELAARIEAREVSPVAVTRAQLDRIAALDGALGSYAQVMAEVAMAASRDGGGGDRRGPVSRAAARRADRGEGSVLDQGLSDRGRHGDPQGLPPGRRCDRGAPPDRGRRGVAGQAAAHRRRLLRSPPVRDAARESMECRILARHIVQRLGGRRRRRVCAMARSAPIPAARSAGPAPPTASLG